MALYRWHAWSNDAYAFVRDIADHVLTKSIHSQLLIQFDRHRLSRGTRMTEQVAENREQLIATMEALNSRGLS